MGRRSNKSERIYARWFHTKSRTGRYGSLAYRADGKRSDRYWANWNKKELGQNIRKMFRKKTSRRIHVHGQVVLNYEDGTSQEMSITGFDLTEYKKRSGWDKADATTRKQITHDYEYDLLDSMDRQIRKKVKKYGKLLSNMGRKRWIVTVTHT